MFNEKPDYTSATGTECELQKKPKYDDSSLKFRFMCCGDSDCMAPSMYYVTKY